MKDAATAKAISLLNVLGWCWAIHQLVFRQHSAPFAKLLTISIAINFMKRGFRQPRPFGASGCDAFGLCGRAKSYGMPSGHVASAVAAAVLIIETYQIPVNKAAVAAIIGAAMTWSRVTLGCHTLWQSLVGGILGWIFVRS